MPWSLEGRISICMNVYPPFGLIAYGTHQQGAIALLISRVSYHSARTMSRSPFVLFPYLSKGLFTPGARFVTMWLFIMKEVLLPCRLLTSTAVFFMA